MNGKKYASRAIRRLPNALKPRNDTSKADPRSSNLTPKILIVDDEAVVRRTVARVLRNGQPNRYDAEFAASAEEALARLKVKHFDAVITDIVMAGESGIELLRRLNDAERRIPVILLTGRPQTTAAADAVNLRAFRYFVKPVPPEELRDAVERAVKMSRLATAAKPSGSPPPMLATEELSLSFNNALETLQVFFQPIVDANGAPCAYEALARPQNDHLNNPLVLFEAARVLGQTIPLGHYVQRLALECVDETQKNHDLFINVSPRELMTRDPAASFPAAPAKHGASSWS